MTISDRIFERLNQLSMTQKEFAEKTGILQSTISEWKKNKTNPSSDKIMAICQTLVFHRNGFCQELIRLLVEERIKNITLWM